MHSQSRAYCDTTVIRSVKAACVTGGVVLYTVVAADRLKAHVRTFTIFITSTSQVIFCHFTVVAREMIELEIFIIDKFIVNYTSNGRNVDI